MHIAVLDDSVYIVHFVHIASLRSLPATIKMKGTTRRKMPRRLCSMPRAEGSGSFLKLISRKYRMYAYFQYIRTLCVWRSIQMDGLISI